MVKKKSTKGKPLNETAKQEKSLPKKRTKVLAEKKPSNGYKDNGVKEFVEDNPNGKEDFDALLKAFVTPRK